MPSQYMIPTRLTILFFTLLSLAVASLNSANAHLSIALRDRARSNYINTADGILDNKFQELQSNALIVIVFTALAIIVFVIYGAVIAVHPRWLRDYEEALCVFAIAQIFLAFIMIVTGSFLTENVQGFYTSFEKSSAPTTTSRITA